ncbi:MAG: hypothetical protein R2755_29435 [Acidimicrobiales bacterium]
MTVVTVVTGAAATCSTVVRESVARWASPSLSCRGVFERGDHDQRGRADHRCPAITASPTQCG